MKLRSIHLAILTLLLAITAQAPVAGGMVDDDASDVCIPVTVLQPFAERAFLPLVLRSGTGTLLQDVPTVQEVTEDTGGCLQFVGDTIHFALHAGESGGSATVDIGETHEGIILFDDGSSGDSVAGDGVYERDYVATSADIVRSATVAGRFTPSEGEPAEPVYAPGVVTITDWEAGETSVDPFVGYVTDPDTGDQYAANRMVIGFTQGTSLDTVTGILIDNDLTLAGWIPELLLFEAELAQGQDYEVIRQELLASPSVEAVERNYAMELLGPSQTIPDEHMPVDQANYLNPIRAKVGWSITKGSASIEVATIDTGVDETHPDLVGQIEAFYACPICGTGDWNGHGTFIAGIIAAEQGTTGMSGVAPGVRLLVYKQEYVMNPFTTARDIYLAQRQGARVISLSMCHENDIAVRQAVEYAYNRNVVLIAAVAETGKCDGAQEFFKDNQAGSHKLYPASFEQVLAVGSAEPDDTIASYSDYGDQVVYAPVPLSGILSTDRFGGYKRSTGTSFAAPQVAALAALILSVSVEPDLSNDQVIDIITQTADDMPDQPGLGRINVYRALTVAMGLPDPGPNPLPSQVTMLHATLETTPTPAVNLTWTKPSSDYAGVYMYRQKKGQDYVEQLEGGLITGTSYTDELVTNGSIYDYYAFAVDAIGQESVEYDDSGTVCIASTSGEETLEFVSQMGGATFAVAVQDDYAYVGIGQRVGVLDVSDPSNPTLLGRSELFDDLVVDIAVQGDYVYASTLSGLVVLDVVSPSSPTVVNDDMAYSGYSGGPGREGGIEVRGDYAYIATSLSLLIIDISDPVNPMIVASPGVAAEEIAIAGNYAYATDRQHDLRIVDISSPTTPVIVGSYPGDFYSVAAADSYAYVADPNSGVRVLDVTDPSTPTPVTLINDSDFPTTVALAGNRLYVGAAFMYGGLDTFDVTSPSTPVALGSLDGVWPYNIEINSHVFVTDSWTQSLRIVSMFDAAHPVVVGAYVPIMPLGLTLRDSYAYVGDRSGLRILDADDPGSPTILGSWEDWLIPKEGVALYGNYAYVTSGDGQIYILDISNPAAPVEAGRYGTLEIAYSVEVVDGYAYVANGSRGLRVLSLANPTRPVEVGYYDTSWDAQGLDVAGDHVYVADDAVWVDGEWVGGGLSIIDITDPTAPDQVAYYRSHAPNRVRAVAVRGNYAYVTYDSDRRLEIVDVSDPSRPSRVSAYELDPRWEVPTSVAVYAGYAFVGTSSGLVVLDVSDPACPLRAASFKVGDPWVEDVALQGDHVFLAAHSKGLWILRFTGSH